MDQFLYFFFRLFGGIEECLSALGVSLVVLVVATVARVNFIVTNF